MRPWLHYFFSTVRHWHSYLPWRHFHLPAPSPTLLPFPPQLSYSKTAIYIPPVKSVKSRQPGSQAARQPTREAHSYRGCAAPLLLVYGKSHERQSFLPRTAHCYSLFATVSEALTSMFPKLPPLTTPNKSGRKVDYSQK